MTEETPSGDTTKIILPTRRGPRAIDLVLAAVAGSLVTVLAILVLFLGNQRAQAATTAAPATAAPTTAPLATP